MVEGENRLSFTLSSDLHYAVACTHVCMHAPSQMIKLKCNILNSNYLAGMGPPPEI